MGDRELAKIHGYNYKPAWVRHCVQAGGEKSGHRLLGVELELVFCDESDRDDFRRRVLPLTEGTRPHVLLKHDGSLPEDRSVEVVFHPHHLATLASTVEAITKMARQADAYSNYEDAGQHVHVARAGIPLTAQGGFLLFWNLLDAQSVQGQRLLGRTETEYCQRSKDALKRPFQALASTDHRAAVDAQRDSTMEVRVFASSTDADAVMGRAALVDAVAEYCRRHPLTEAFRHGLWRERYAFPAVLDWAKKSGEYEPFVKLAAA